MPPRRETRVARAFPVAREFVAHELLTGLLAGPLAGLLDAPHQAWSGMVPVVGSTPSLRSATGVGEFGRAAGEQRIA